MLAASLLSAAAMSGYRRYGPTNNALQGNSPLILAGAFGLGSIISISGLLVWQRLQRRITDQAGAFSALACHHEKDSSDTAISNAKSICAPSEQKVNLAEKPQRTNWNQATESAYSQTSKTERMKLILCVRTDLGMGKGKIAAQCCHAAVGVVGELLKSDNPQHKEMLERWEELGQAKICVRVDNEEQLETLCDVADAMGVPNYAVHDAGHTQVAPDTLTVAAIGPGPASLIDQITGNLKLLG